MKGRVGRNMKGGRGRDRNMGNGRTGGERGRKIIKSTF